MRAGMARRLLLIALIAAVGCTAMGIVPAAAQEDGRAAALEEGLDALAEERFDDAEAIFVEALERSRLAGDRGTEGRLHFYLALTEQLRGETGDLDRAAAEYRRALELLPGDADAANNLAQVYRQQGRWSEALPLFESAMRGVAGERRAVFATHYGDALLEHGRWENAVQAWSEALRAAPRDRAVQERIFDVLEEHDPAGLPRLVRDLVAAGEVDAAERYAGQALQNPDLPQDVASRLLPALAAALARQNRPPGEIDPATAAALRGAGEGASQLLRLLEGTTSSYDWWSAEESRSLPFRELARSLADRSGVSGHYGRAEDLYRLAEALAPPADVDPALDRAELYAALGRDDDLASLLMELDGRIGGLEPSQRSLKAHTALGVLFQGLAERRPELLDRAISNLEQAVDLSRRYGRDPEDGFPAVDPASLLEALSEAYDEKGGEESEEQRLLTLLRKAEVYAGRPGGESAADEILREVEADPLQKLFSSVRRKSDQLDRIVHGTARVPKPPIEVLLPEPARSPGVAPPSGPSELRGIVRDEAGNPLPGATVTVSGGAFPYVTVSDAEGRFRIPGLSPHTYEVEAQLEGFSSVGLPLAEIGVGGYQVEITLNTAIEDVITVSAESPLLQSQTAASVSALGQELRMSPLLPSTLPVSGFPEGGAPEGLTLRVDGVEVPGAVPLSIEPRTLDGVSVSMGGVSAAAFGPMLDLVTRTADADLRGTAWVAGEAIEESGTGVDSLDLGRSGPWNGFNGQGPVRGDRALRSFDLGADVGGPLFDRFHLWGSYGLRERDLERLGGIPESTRSETASAKGLATIGSRNSLNAYAQSARPEGTGRGAGPDRALETTWDESATIDVVKLEDTHAFTNEIFLTALASRVEERSSLDPRGGTSEPAVWDGDLVWRGSFLGSEVRRKQEQQKLDLSYWYGGHALGAGLSFQSLEETATSLWPLAQYERFSLVEVHAPSLARGRVEAVGAYLQDTWYRDALTLSLGARYDLQGGENLPSTVPADPRLPELLPGGRYAGAEAPFDWALISPRLGLSYRFGDRTVLRAGYGRYSERLTPSTLLAANPAAQRSVLFSEAISGPIQGLYGVDPTRPGLVPLGGLDPGLRPGITDEIVLGAEQRVGGFALTATLSFRNEHDLLEMERLVYDDGEGRSGIGRPHRRSDYELFGTVFDQLPNGGTYTVHLYRLRPGVTSLGGLLATNGDRERDTFRATLTAYRPLSNRWMMRGLLSWTESRWRVPDGENEDPTNLLGSSDDDGAFVLREIPGVGPQPSDLAGQRWSFDLFGLYQIAPDRPWGLNAALLLTGREGGPIPYVRRLGPEETGDGILRYVQVTGQPDRFRTPDVFLLHGRLEKELVFDDLTVTLGVNALNLLDRKSALRREIVLDAPRADHLEETTTGRSFLFELRLRYR